MKNNGNNECDTYRPTYIPITLYPRRGSRGISDIPPRRLTNYLAMRNTTDVTGDKHIAV
jgi:hypothetical protein